MRLSTALAAKYSAVGSLQAIHKLLPWPQQCQQQHWLWLAYHPCSAVVVWELLSAQPWRFTHHHVIASGVHLLSCQLA